MSTINLTNKLKRLLILYLVLIPTSTIGSFALFQPENPNENNFIENNKRVTRSTPSIVGNPALIVLSTDTRKSMQEASDYINEIGGRVLNVYPTHVLVAYLTKIHKQLLVEREGFENISFTTVDSSSVSKYGEQAVLAVDAWNHYVQSQLIKSLEGITNIPEPGPIYDDIRYSDEINANGTPDIISNAPYGAKFYDTSEYMIGDISVVIIFPESNGEYDGNQENWASWDFPVMLSEIQEGLNWWALRAPMRNA